MGPRVTPPRGPKKAKRGRASEETTSGPDRIAVAPRRPYGRPRGLGVWPDHFVPFFVVCVLPPKEQMCRYFLWSHAWRAVWRRRIRAGVQRVIQLSE